MFLINSVSLLLHVQNDPRIVRESRHFAMTRIRECLLEQLASLMVGVSCVSHQACEAPMDVSTRLAYDAHVPCPRTDFDGVG